MSGIGILFWAAAPTTYQAVFRPRFEL